MVEQLSLRLETGLPKLPALAPMWPTPESEAFDSPTHLFEPIWGGHRALAYIGPARVAGAGDVRILDPTGRDLTPMLPELSGLAVRVAARSAILDGELVCTDEGGRADDEALRARLSGERGRPVAFLVFDLLDLDGSSLLRQPLTRRRRELRRVLRPGDEVVVVPAIVERGSSAVRRRGRAGAGGRPGARLGIAVPARGSVVAVAIYRCLDGRTRRTGCHRRGDAG